jgi:hypothetical protein
MIYTDTIQKEYCTILILRLRVIMENFLLHPRHYKGIFFLRHTHFLLGERDPATHWIAGWLESAAGMDVLETRKISHAFLQS